MLVHGGYLYLSILRRYKGTGAAQESSLHRRYYVHRRVRAVLRGDTEGNALGAERYPGLLTG